MLRFRLVDNWRAVLRHAWSLRLVIGAALLSGLEVAVQVVIAYGVTSPLPAGVFAAVAGLITIAAAIARLVAQRNVSGDV